MSLLLAVEPDSKQSAILKDIARRQLGAALVIVRSTDEAVAAIQKRLPDLILMSALVPPRDEAALNDHLRGVAGTEHVQTVSIPFLAHPTPRRARSGRFESFRRKGGKEKTGAATGCDPSIFGAEIAEYLKQAAQRRPVPPGEEIEVETRRVPPDQEIAEETPAYVARRTATCDVKDVPAVIEEATSVAEIDEIPAAIALLEATCVEDLPAIVEEQTRLPIALLEATCSVEHPPAIVDEIFRAMVEETPLPPQRAGKRALGTPVPLACLAGVLAPVGVPEDLPVESAPATRREGVEAFFRDWRSADPSAFAKATADRRSLGGGWSGARRGPRPPVSASHAERLELWHSLPLLGHVAPSLQGPEVRERPIVAPPVVEPDVEVAPLPSAITRLSPTPAGPESVEPVPAVVAAAVPDEWGFYNPSACGFEALMHTLQRIEAAREPPSVERPRRKKGTPKRASQPSIRAEASNHPTTEAPPPLVASGTVTDEILQSLRLPRQIAALGRPTGCRIRKRKRAPRRRFRAGQRPPEPLIIVSKRMLELG